MKARRGVSPRRLSVLPHPCAEILARLHALPFPEASVQAFGMTHSCDESTGATPRCNPIQVSPYRGCLQETRQPADPKGVLQVDIELLPLAAVSISKMSPSLRRIRDQSNWRFRFEFLWTRHSFRFRFRVPVLRGHDRFVADADLGTCAKEYTLC